MLNQKIKSLRNVMQNTKDKRLYERFLSVLLHLESRNFPKISNIIGHNCQIAMNYCNSYEEGGISGFQMKKPTGKPKKLSKEQQEHLDDIIVNKTPAEVGFESKYIWTLQLIASRLD